ncbi:MAG: glycosyltransferase, partial [Verrucomicrobiales bacterium]|nr:glycosyltransferase [Verrucomicrobiales bacterium]
FRNRFVGIDELKEFIGAADLYLTPYHNEAQVTSGTLAYAFGSGKAVVSTPYWHAAELLAEGRGVLVPFRDAKAIAREVIGLLRDDTRRHAMRKAAYKLGREMTWPCTAKRYLQSFERARVEGAVWSRKTFAIKTLDQAPRELPSLRLDHLTRMTDSTGLFQHAIFTVPNFSEGYCSDDNARAFILAMMLHELGEEPERIRALATHYVAFLHHAFAPGSKRFHNHLSFDRHWIDAQGSEDSHGRTLWALGTGVGRSPYHCLQVMAGQIFAEALPVVAEFSSPRAWAFALLGVHEYLRRLNGDRAAHQMRDALIARLMDLYDRTAREDWPWFEDVLSYDNAKLAHALILCGHTSGQTAVFERGLKALRWLIAVQSAENGDFRSIGSNGFYPRDGVRATFDQQPIEAHSMISACLEAYRTTSDRWWYDQALRTFDWFLGWNDLGLELYDPTTGGCRDALHVDRVNQNQGAESTLAFLLSLAEIRLVQNAETVFHPTLPG